VSSDFVSTLTISSVFRSFSIRLPIHSFKGSYRRWEQRAKIVLLERVSLHSQNLFTFSALNRNSEKKVLRNFSIVSSILFSSVDLQTPFCYFISHAFTFQFHTLTSTHTSLYPNHGLHQNRFRTGLVDFITLKECNNS